MKRLLLMAFAVIIFACGCKKPDNNNDKISIVTTMFTAYDFAKEMAGDNADVTMLIRPGSESHAYEPTPKDIIAIRNCDIFIYVGGENDAWVEDILDSIENKDMQIVKMMDYVKLYAEEGEESDEEEWDEHVWTSLSNADAICKEIKDLLIKIDVSSEKSYENNYKTYSARLMELKKEFEEMISTSKRKEIIFADRFGARYFVEEFGLSYYAAFPGCAGETEPSAKTVAFLIDKIKEDGIPAVFVQELSSGGTAEAIREDTGAKVLTFYTGHNVSETDFSRGVGYTELMQRNYDALKEALN